MALLRPANSNRIGVARSQGKSSVVFVFSTLLVRTSLLYLDFVATAYEQLRKTQLATLWARAGCGRSV